jgi:uroporphyrinogen-III synthase
MPKSVVITRPLAQAEPLAQQVAALGREPVVFPLLEIHPLPDPAPLCTVLNDLQRYAMVAFVSPNAIDAALAVLPAWPSGLPIAIIGDGSRRALAKHGISDANATIFSPGDAARTDSETLLAALDKTALKDKQVLIIRGETGRELMANELRAAGILVTQVAAYRRIAPVFDDACRSRLMQLLAREHDWIVTSSEALRNLMRMVEQLGASDGVAKMQQHRIFVPHARIAETAQILGLHNITLTGAGDERLLAALQFEP